MCCILFLGVCFLIGLLFVFFDEIRAHVRDFFGMDTVSSIFVKECKIDESREASVCYEELVNYLTSGEVNGKSTKLHLESVYNDLMTYVYGIRDPSEISRLNTSYFKVFKIRFDQVCDYSLNYLTSVVKRKIIEDIYNQGAYGYENGGELPFETRRAVNKIIKNIEDNGVCGVQNTFEPFSWATPYPKKINKKKEYNVRTGVIGLKRLSGSEDLLISICFINDKWIEKNVTSLSVSDNKTNWSFKNLIDFSKYLLINEMINKMKLEKENMIDMIIKEDGFELYQWLESIGYVQYYTLFKEAGYEKERTIATITEDSLINDICIPKAGHVQDLKIYVNELNERLTSNQRW